MDAMKQSSKNSQDMEATTNLWLCHTCQVVNNVNGTVATLTLNLSMDDDGRTLTCRVQTPQLSGSAIEESIRMQVYCEYAISAKIRQSTQHLLRNFQKHKMGGKFKFESNLPDEVIRRPLMATKCSPPWNVAG